MYANFFNEWIGDVPEKVKVIKEFIEELLNEKMTEMMSSNSSQQSIESQHPISFESNNKVFYWNPEQLKFPWEKENIH